MKKNNQLVQKSSTPDLGITAVIIYSMIFIYAYMNSYYKRNLGFSIIDPNKSFTITHAMFNSEKIGVSVFLALYVATTMYILYKQKFYKKTLGFI